MDTGIDLFSDVSDTGARFERLDLSDESSDHLNTDYSPPPQKKIKLNNNLVKIELWTKMYFYWSKMFGIKKVGFLMW